MGLATIIPSYFKSLTFGLIFAAVSILQTLKKSSELFVILCNPGGFTFLFVDPSIRWKHMHAKPFWTEGFWT